MAISVGKTHRFGPEEARVHLGQIVCDPGPKPHVRQDISLHVDTGRDLGELQSVGTAAKDGPFRDVRNRLATLTAKLRVVRELVEPRHEFAMLAFGGDHRATFGPRDVETASREGATEDDPLARSD